MRIRRIDTFLSAFMIWLLPAATVLAGKPEAAPPTRAALQSQLAVLLAVGRQGEGNVAASQAWRVVAAADSAALGEVLAALEDAQPLAANWIASAAEAIAERAARSKDGLPLDDLRAFVLETSHASRGRALAFEWLKKADQALADRMTPGFLHDPSPELRRVAVARLIGEAAAQKAGRADDDRLRSLYREALSGACDLDQVKQIKGELEKRGEKVNLAEHFGFVTSWHVIGPFDNRGERGFDVEYPPERQIDLAARYEGKPSEGKARDVAWQLTTTKDEFGVVDLNKVIGQENGVVAYAWTEFCSDRERPAELRLGRDNAYKLWLNGRLVHQNGVYHSGSEMDQFVGLGTLHKGRNRILVKVLQNEQKEDWAQGWGFQLRVCDSAGQAIHSTKQTEGTLP